MKFLNEIDGASKLKQDSSNRLVTDVQKASWNSKAEGNHSHSKNEITDFPTSLPASGGQSTTTEHLVGDDTRSVNSPPSVYMSSGSRWAGRAGWQTEFKHRSTIGSPSSLSGTYVYLQTHTPWSDPSGGYPVQIAYGNGAPSWRVGISDSAWSDWESFNDNGNAATVNGKTVLTDVPINAKFTDTTYTEITTAEIDTGTASTLRTITGRRVKYILDKIQGWIGGLTKSDVGLSNVDNVKQATKVEFDELDSKVDVQYLDTNASIGKLESDVSGLDTRVTQNTSKIDAFGAELKNIKLPNATDTEKGVVKISSLTSESEPYTAVSIGKLEEAIAPLLFNSNIPFFEIVDNKFYMKIFAQNVEEMEKIVEDEEKMSTLLKSKNVKTLKPYETATGELIPLKGKFKMELLSGESEDYMDIYGLLMLGDIPIATKLEATDNNDIAYYYDLG